MAQNEMRFRLIRDGKIAKGLDGKVGYVVAELHGGGLVGWTSQAWDVHDSFELGFKDEEEGWDEWRFEGDIFEFQSLTDAKYIGILQYSGYQWHMGTKNEHGVGISFPLHDLICDECYIKHIGNIHEDNLTIGLTNTN